MKKLSILLIGLLLVTGLAFGQEVTVEGDASVTFGYDLDAGFAGFKNGASADITLEWLGADETSGTQGWINLEGWEITFTTDFDADEDETALTIGAPDVEAGWFFEPVTITIYAEPGLSMGNADGFLWIYDEEVLDEEDDKDFVDPALSNKNVLTPAVAAGSVTEGVVTVITIAEYVLATADPLYDGYLVDALLVDVDDDGFPDYAIYVAEVTTATAAVDAENTVYGGLTAAIDLGVATVTLEAASDGDWTDSENDFAIGASVSAAAGPANVVAGVYAGPFDEMDLGFSVGVDAAVGPATVDIGFDGFKGDGAADLDWDASVDIGVDVSGISLSSNTYLWSVAGADLDMSQEVVLDASDVVEGLGFTETFQLVALLEVLQPMMWWSKTEVSYDMDGIKPYAALEVDYDTVIDVTAGVELTGFVENTVFTLEYDVDDVSDTMMGVITFDATITY